MKKPDSLLPPDTPNDVPSADTPSTDTPRESTGMTIPDNEIALSKPHRRLLELIMGLQLQLPTTETEVETPKSGDPLSEDAA